MNRTIDGVIAFLFSAAIIALFIDWFPMTRVWLQFPNSVLVVIGFLFTFYVIFRGNRRFRSGRWFPAVLLAFGLILFSPFSFIYHVFGTQDVGSVLITSQENPPGQMLRVAFGSFPSEIFKYIAISFAVIFGGAYLCKTIPNFNKFALALGATFLFFSPVSSFAYRTIVPNPNHELIQLEKDKRRPLIAARPSQKKNIVFMYLESVERTYRDIPETAEAFAPLASLEDMGLSFNNITEVLGTAFTGGGLVASQCGVPLLPRGMINVRRQIRGGINVDAYQFDGFMDHILCLGDILAEDGYIGSYMNGSDLAIFSKGKFFETHGHERLFGVDMLPGSSDENYENVWGLNDETIFDYAHNELEYLVSLDRPFTMSLLTVSTHGPDAELDRSCLYPEVAGSYIPAAIRCTGDHVKRLVDKIDELGISDDTIIVVLSDHLAMRNSVYHLFEERADERRNQFVILGAGGQAVISKKGSMLDVYPTILEVMGYELVDRQANMGVSLLSEESTLAERLGVDLISEAFDRNHDLKRALWYPEP